MSEPLFTLSGVSFSHPGNMVLNDLNLSLQPALFYGIIGPNGCGKTTLLDLLCGMKKNQQGEILFSGRKLRDIGRRELARNMALVPQEFDTGFGFTVEEIVMMGRHPHINRFAAPTPRDWQSVDLAMRQIGIFDIRHQLATTLSGGQKQRAIVARALAQDTKVLLLDEATASLDVKYSLQIFKLARHLVSTAQRTVIAVVHDLNLAAGFCDHLVFLKEGTIMAQGETATTMTPQTLREVFEVDTQIHWNEYSKSMQISYPYRDGIVDQQPQELP